jgi:hypothetical protein
MPAETSRSLLAAVYDDGIAADRILSDLGYDLRAQGIAVRGLVQRNTFRRDRAKCDMELEELGSGRVFQLSKDRGKHAGGCRLDREAILTAATVMASGLEANCEFLIINKFGRSEAEGGGLRELIAEAVSRGIPAIVGIPRRNLEVWERFAGDLSDRCEAGDLHHMRNWIESRIAQTLDVSAAPSGRRASERALDDGIVN